MLYIENSVLFLSKYVMLRKNYFESKLVQLNKFLLDESNGRGLFYYRKGAEGARCTIHLNSQAKGPLLDRTLESFSINTEGVISTILEKSLR